MQCPRCSHNLISGAYESHAAFFCSECSGTLFEQVALGKTLERLSIELFSVIDSDFLIPPLPDIKGELDCPKCQAQMENYGYMGAKQVMLDACNRCEVIWVDPLELATMAQMCGKLGKNTDKTRAGEGPSNTVENQDTIQIIVKAMMTRFVKY